MSRARNIANADTTHAPLASPTFTGTTTSAGLRLSGGAIEQSDGTDLLTEAGALGSAVVFPAGHIVQVQTASTDTATNFGDGAGTFTAITGMTMTITPIFPNSKILIHFNCGGMVDGYAGSIGTKITGTTTGDVQIQSRYGYAVPDGWKPIPFAVTAIDTPGNILTQTYAFYCSTANSLAASAAIANSDDGNDNSGTTILYEIKV